MLTVSIAFFVFATAILSYIDAQTKRLPNKFLIPSVIIIHVLLITAALGAQNKIEKTLEVLTGTVVMFIFFFVIAVISKGQLGAGDVKLAALLGPMLGFVGGLNMILVAITVICLLGGVWAAIVVLITKNSKGFLAFGPVMVLGSWASLLSRLDLTVM